MRLAHFVEQGSVVGGVERYLADLLAADATALAHSVVLHEGAGCAFAGHWPVVSMAWSAGRAGREHADAGRVMEGLDAVCLFHYPPRERILAAARAAGLPVALFCHDHRWWCASASRYHRRTRRICGIRGSTLACALRYHSLHCGSFRLPATAHGFARAAAGRAALHGADVVLAASSFMAEEAVRHGADPRRTHIVPLPTAFAGRSAAAAGGEALPPPPVVLYASRLTPEKGPATLLEAFALMREPARLELAGAGIGTAATERMVARHPKVADIRLLGHLNRRDIEEAYARAAVVVVPSLWPEPFGLVGIEALASGRPVVATSAGGTTDWARTELGVLTVPPGDSAALAAGVDRVLADPAWAARARDAGAPWVRERHSVASHAARLQELLAPLMEKSERA